MAEALFRSIVPKTRVLGHQVTYKDSRGTMRFELWKTGTLILQYDYNNRGYRHLGFFPKIMENELIQSFRAAIEPIQQQADVFSY